MTLSIKKTIILFLSLLVLSTPLAAQTSITTPANSSGLTDGSVPPKKVASADRLTNWSATLLSTEQALSRSGLSEDELALKSDETSKIRIEALGLDSELAPLAAKVKEQLDQLGPAPAEGEPAESEDISKNRKLLESNFAKLDGELKAGRLISIRAAQIEQQIIDNRRQRFVSQITRHTSSLLSVQLWSSFFGGLDKIGDRFVLFTAESYSVIKLNAGKSVLNPVLLLGGFMLITLVAVFMRRLLEQKQQLILALRKSGPINHYTKTRLAGVNFIKDGIIPAGVIFSLYILLTSLNLLTPRLDSLLFEVTLIGAALTIGFSLARNFLRPIKPELRIATLSDHAAQKISGIIFIGVLLVAVLRLTNKMAVILVSPFEVSVTLSAVLSLICFVSVFLVLKTVATDSITDPSSLPIRRNPIRWGFLGAVFWLSCIAGIISLLIGYIAFAEFLTWQILIAAVIFALLWLIIELLDLSRDRYLDVNDNRWHHLSNTTGFSQQAVLQGSVFGFGLTKLLIVLAAGIVFMASWGYRTGDWARPISEAFFGFNIGGLSISFSSIALAVGLFVGGYFITRTVRFWLRFQFLPTTKLDPGLRNSIATVFGYIGIVLAALMAITAAGLDLSKVAIIAGALSVGIGFGLQSIVNNFVSGLILLAERPIKSGDWIVTSGGQGTVRKTSVRSTEIETFDGATVIIPNSTLITEAVTNWTHHDQKGRIIIAVGVGYDSDPEQVREILLKCADEHERVIENPSANVYFMDFGADALMFELRAYLADVNGSVSTKSDLRFAILKALREANIEIPYPQRDVHIKTTTTMPPEPPKSRPKTTRKPTVKSKRQ